MLRSRLHETTWRLSSKTTSELIHNRAEQSRTAQVRYREKPDSRSVLFEMTHHFTRTKLPDTYFAIHSTTDNEFLMDEENRFNINTPRSFACNQTEFGARTSAVTPPAWASGIVQSNSPVAVSNDLFQTAGQRL